MPPWLRRSTRKPFCLSTVVTETLELHSDRVERERSFKACKTITADTPVEYFEAADLPIAPITAAMVPRRFTARSANRAGIAVESNPLTIVLVMTGRHGDHDIASRLRKFGYTVHNDFDTAISSEYDLSKSKNQSWPKALIPSSDFVFFSPPCLTSCIAFDPPLRSVHHPKGVPGLSKELQELVDNANVLYDLVAECAQLCDMHNVGNRKLRVATLRPETLPLAKMRRQRFLLHLHTYASSLCWSLHQKQRRRNLPPKKGLPRY